MVCLRRQSQRRSCLPVQHWTRKSHRPIAHLEQLQYTHCVGSRGSDGNLAEREGIQYVWRRYYHIKVSSRSHRVGRPSGFHVRTQCLFTGEVRWHPMFVHLQLFPVPPCAPIFLSAHPDDLLAGSSSSILSICSRLNPFVSGTKKKVKTRPAEQVAAQTKKTFGPRFAFFSSISNGVRKLITQFQNQLLAVAIATPFARTDEGKSSPVTTHAVGAHVHAHAATRTHASPTDILPLVSASAFETPTTPIASSDKIISEAPYSRSARRPIRSIVQNDSGVAAKFTVFTTTVIRKGSGNCDVLKKPVPK